MTWVAATVPPTVALRQAAMFRGMSTTTVLWLRRSNDKFFSLSRNTFLPDFDYEFGGRYTVGGSTDCVNGWEGVYTGPYDWQRQTAMGSR